MVFDIIFNRRERHRIIFLGALIALLLTFGLTAIARIYTVLPLDLWFTRELQEHQWALIARFMYAISIFGYMPWSVITIPTGALIALWLAGWRAAFYLPFITGIQGLINLAIKAAIGRPRPVSNLVEVFVPEQGYSFPSGHVMFYTVFFGFLIFLVLTNVLNRRLRQLLVIVFGGLILLVGPSRIILGSHWLSDVTAAYLISTVILVFAIEFYLEYVVPAFKRHALEARDQKL